MMLGSSTDRFMIKSKCIFCSDMFHSFSECLEHLTVEHFKCEQCNMCLFCEIELQKHIRRKHRKKESLLLTDNAVIPSFINSAMALFMKKDGLLTKKLSKKYNQKRGNRIISFHAEVKKNRIEGKPNHSEMYIVTYRCVFCPRVFVQFGDYFAHLKASHHRCDSCNTYLLTRGKLQKHKSLCHNETVCEPIMQKSQPTIVQLMQSNQLRTIQDKPEKSVQTPDEEEIIEIQDDDNDDDDSFDVKCEFSGKIEDDSDWIEIVEPKILDIKSEEDGINVEEESAQEIPLNDDSIDVDVNEQEVSGNILQRILSEVKDGENTENDNPNEISNDTEIKQVPVQKKTIPFQCVFCSLVFLQFSDYEEHLTNDHSKCSFCDDLFSSREELCNHSQINHSTECQGGDHEHQNMLSSDLTIINNMELEPFELEQYYQERLDSSENMYITMEEAKILQNKLEKKKSRKKRPPRLSGEKRDATQENVTSSSNIDCSSNNRNADSCKKLKRNAIVSSDGDFITFKCVICSITFDQFHNYESHLSKHDDLYRFACEQCGECFMYRSDLDSHKQLQHACQAGRQESAYDENTDIDE